MKYIISALSVALILTGLFCWHLIFGITVSPLGGESRLFIFPRSSFDLVMDSLVSRLKIDNINVLRWVAEKKKYPVLIKPGRYVVERGTSCNELINILRAGKQAPVMVTFNNIRTIYDLAGIVGGRIEADSAQIAAFLLTRRITEAKDRWNNIISVFILFL